MVMKPDPGDDREQPEYALGGRRLAQQDERADRGQHRPGAARDRIDHREVGDLIAALQAQAVAEMDDGAEHEAAGDGQAPVQVIVDQHPDHPRQIDEAGEQIGGEHEGRAGSGGALGKQIPGGVDEGGEDDEGKRDERHETSVPSGANKDLDISSSGLLSLGCSRVLPRFPQRSDRRWRRAIRNPSCHSVDGTLISTGIRRGQSGILLQARKRCQAARSCNSSDEPRISTLRPLP